MSYPNVRVVGADEVTTTAAAAAALVVVAAKAKLFTVSAYNGVADGTTTLYLQAHDVTAATSLSNGVTVPKLVTPVFAGLSGGFNFVDGAIFKTGIYLCFSSTAMTWTLAAGSPGLIDATFRRI